MNSSILAENNSEINFEHKRKICLKEDKSQLIPCLPIQNSSQVTSSFCQSKFIPKYYNIPDSSVNIHEKQKEFEFLGKRMK